MRRGEKPVITLLLKPWEVPSVRKGLGRRQEGKVTTGVQAQRSKPGRSQVHGAAESPTAKRQGQRLGQGRRENKSAPSPSSPGLDTSPSHSTLRILSWWLSLPSLQTLHILPASSRGGQAKGTEGPALASTAWWTSGQAAPISSFINWTSPDNLHCLPHGKAANQSVSQKFLAEPF